MTDLIVGLIIGTIFVFGLVVGRLTNPAPRCQATEYIFVEVPQGEKVPL